MQQLFEGNTHTAVPHFRRTLESGLDHQFYGEYTVGKLRIDSEYRVFL